MKAKITILLLSILFLWGSVSVYSRQPHSPGAHQIKASTESMHVAIAPTFAFEVRVLEHGALLVLVNFVYTKAIASLQRVSYFSPFIHKSVKTCIVFRTLRN